MDSWIHSLDSISLHFLCVSRFDAAIRGVWGDPKSKSPIFIFAWFLSTLGMSSFRKSQHPLQSCWGFAAHLARTLQRKSFGGLSMASSARSLVCQKVWWPPRPTNKTIQDETKFHQVAILGSQVCSKSHRAGRSPSKLDRPRSSSGSRVLVNLPVD